MKIDRSTVTLFLFPTSRKERSKSRFLSTSLIHSEEKNAIKLRLSTSMDKKEKEKEKKEERKMQFKTKKHFFRTLTKNEHEYFDL